MRDKLFESLHPIVQLFDISDYRRVDYLPAAYSFFQQIYDRIYWINTTTPYHLTSILKPLLFFCKEHRLLATVDLDSDSGKLSTDSIKAYSPIEKYTGIYPKKKDDTRTGPFVPISASLPEILEAYIDKFSNSGYTVIEIIIPESDLIDADKLPNHCWWCGSTVEQHTTKSFEYCPKCKATANGFLVTLNGILDEWKQYRQYISTGETDKANTIKSKSKYAYLLDDSARYEYVVTTHKLDQFNHPEFVLLNETLMGIKQILRPLVYRDTLQPANYNKEQYDAGKIGPYCPVCGKIIPPDKHIDSKYCSGECGYKFRNMRKKERK